MSMQEGVLKRDVTLQLVPKVLLSSEPVKAKRQRRVRRQDREVAGVYALIEGLRAGKAKIDELRIQAAQAEIAERLERRQETRTKLVAFGLFYMMAGLMLWFMWAGIQG